MPGQLRWRAVDGLRNIGSEKAIEALSGALTTDEDNNVRWCAASALGSIGGEQAIEPLKRALADESWYVNEKVKDAAFAALEKISRRNSIRITRS